MAVATAPARRREVPARPAAVPLRDIRTRILMGEGCLHILLIYNAEADKHHAVEEVDGRAK